MIETKGLVAAVEAADVMVKTAKVLLVGYEKTGDGIVTVLVRGSVADCRASVDAAAQKVAMIGDLLRSDVIPYADEDVNIKLPVSLKK